MTHPSFFEKENPLTILRSIVETAIDGIILIDTSGTVLMINAAATTLFGYSKEEVLGQNITMLMGSPHREIHHTYIHNYLGTGIKRIIGIGREVDGLRKDGSLFPIRLAVSEMEIHGVKYFTGIIHDLREVKEAQAEIMKLNKELEQSVHERTIELQDAVNLLLETNQQLHKSIDKHKEYEAVLLTTRDELRKSLEKEKELSTLKSRFISMASHEFKTPLSSILSSAALISRYATTEQAIDRNRHVERIKASVNHLNGILSDFLSVTRLDEGQIVPALSRFSLASLVHELKAEAEGLLKKGQHLICQFELEGIEMYSDKGILRNILYNLISNAIKYSDEGKTITCQVTPIESSIRILIQDEGVGIPIEDQKHIGSRFFRASNVVNVPGTGLGLNIVISYLHALKGNLNFKSDEGKGTTFIITIPLTHEK